ncbi:hypothetical protein P8452_10858 [Trifolium repens]|nr:hypothetical protein P8452_10858 [Trifolium repens]
MKLIEEVEVDLQCAMRGDETKHQGCSPKEEALPSLIHLRRSDGAAAIVHTTSAVASTSAEIQYRSFPLQIPLCLKS